MDSNIYCVKCRKRTGSRDITQRETSNGKFLMQAICTECGSKKNRFMKKEKFGEGLFPLGVKPKDGGCMSCAFEDSD